MEIIRKVRDIKQLISEARNQNKSIGFVPTMGALHAGHISLVEQCVKANDICVVSIFVNPTQFNDKNDLKNYPRTLEKDCEILQNAGCNWVFAPEVDEIYPQEDNRIFELGSVADVMEGKYRPGHFNGVAQVVSRLFDIMTPDNAYFGEKDFQQIAVIREMVRQLSYDINIISCPIVRESDGLAMSSRNVRLTPEQRKNAVKISEYLFKSRTFVPEKSVSAIISYVTQEINNVPEMKVEYFEIVDGSTLQSISNWEDTNYCVGCITVFCGNVRLIDNITYFTK